MDEALLAKKQKILSKVENFTLMDDNFMTVFFNDDLECTSYVLQVIMNIPDLKVTANKVRQLKETEAGVSQMCRAVEELIENEKIEEILKMLREGVITEENLSKYSGITPKQLEKILALYHQKVPVEA